MASITLQITNKLGLHARASAKLTQLASRYPCQVWLIRDSRKVNAKSIMGVMMLAASQGTEITLEAEGEQADDCLQDLQRLITDKFGEGQ